AQSFERFDNPKYKTDMNTKHEVAKTIVEQLGNLALSMMGAHTLVADETSLTFSIRGSKAVNKIRITLEPSDTYKVELFKFRNPICNLIAEFNGVYVDSLHTIIESKTGLFLSL